MQNFTKTVFKRKSDLSKENFIPNSSCIVILTRKIHLRMKLVIHSIAIVKV